MGLLWVIVKMWIALGKGWRGCAEWGRGVWYNRARWARQYLAQERGRGNEKAMRSDNEG